MKSLFSTLSLALIVTMTMVPPAFSDAGFQDVLDTPALKSALVSRTLYNGVTLAGKRLVGVGQRGHIVYSDDQGKSWIQSSVPVSSNLTAVCFPTAKTGWAVGHDGVVLKSLNGGVTWVKQLDGYIAGRVMEAHYKEHPPRCLPERRASFLEEVKRFSDQAPDISFLDVWFDNETTGFIIGAFNIIFRTIDGGKNWEPWFDRTENKKFNHLYGIRLIGQDIFICGEQGLVLKLDRHAGFFRAINTPYNGTFFGINGKPGLLIAYGLRGNVFRSTNGGSSWQKVETGIPEGLTGSAVTEKGLIVLVTQAGYLLVSNDGVMSFRKIMGKRPFPASAIVLLDRETLVLAGLYGIHKQSMK